MFEHLLDGHKSPAPIDSAKVEDTGKPVAWMHRDGGSALTARQKGCARADTVVGFDIPCYAAPTTGSAPVAEGWQLTETKNLDALIIAMERAENKGYLPDSIKEAWGEFMCNPARVAPAIPAASVLTDALQELKNIVKAKRFDHEHFEDDTAYADWVQSRARACIALLAASMGEKS